MTLTEKFAQFEPCENCNEVRPLDADENCTGCELKDSYDSLRFELGYVDQMLEASAKYHNLQWETYKRKMPGVTGGVSVIVDKR